MSAFATANWTGGHEWLEGLENAFVWRPTELLRGPHSAIVTHLTLMERKLAKKEVFTFNSFVLKMLLAYELCVTSENSTASLIKLDKLSEELHGLDIVSRDSFYRAVRRAQWHVTMASEAVVLAHKGQLADSKEKVGANFDPLSTFTSTEMAGIYGIKSRSYLEYGANGWEEALKWAKEAIKLNPNEAEWHLIAGMALERIRLSAQRFTGVPKEEFYYFEKAVSLSSQPSQPLYVAKVYSNLISTAFRKNEYDKTFKVSPLYREILNITKRTVLIYQEILRRYSNCTKTQIRCLEGMVKIPKQFLNQTELKPLVERLSKACNESSRFFNAAATYYLKIQKDTTTAMQYLRRGEDAGDFACSINLLRLYVQNDNEKDIDVEQRLMDMVKQYKHHPNGYEEALAHLGAFYLFKERDLSSAITTFNDLLKKNPVSKAMLVHKPMFLRVLHPLNLVVVAVNELRSADVVPGKPGAMSHDRDIFMGLVSRHHRHVLTLPVDVHMMDRILDISDKLERTMKNDKGSAFK